MFVPPLSQIRTSIALATNLATRAEAKVSGSVANLLREMARRAGHNLAELKRLINGNPLPQPALVPVPVSERQRPVNRFGEYMNLASVYAPAAPVRAGVDGREELPMPGRGEGDKTRLGGMSPRRTVEGFGKTEQALAGDAGRWLTIIQQKFDKGELASMLEAMVNALKRGAQDMRAKIPAPSASEIKTPEMKRLDDAKLERIRQSVEREQARMDTVTPNLPLLVALYKFESTASAEDKRRMTNLISDLSQAYIDWHVTRAELKAHVPASNETLPRELARTTYEEKAPS